MGLAMLFTTACAVTDCRQKKIPWLLLGAGLAGGTAAVCNRIWEGSESWYTVLLSVLPGLFLWGLAMVTEGKVGQGDGDMVILLGLMLGWERCSAALCAASLFLAIFSGAGLALKRLKRNSRIPFAPFLAGSCFLIWALTRSALR